MYTWSGSGTRRSDAGNRGYFEPHQLRAIFVALELRIPHGAFRLLYLEEREIFASSGPCLLKGPWV